MYENHHARLKLDTHKPAAATKGSICLFYKIQHYLYKNVDKDKIYLKTRQTVSSSEKHPSPRLQILDELRNFIVPLSAEEKTLLEANILDEGCRDPIVVWEHQEKHYIIDGHNRYGICLHHDLPFNIKVLQFSSIDEVKAWMLDNQLGRRNLTPDQLSYYRGLKYNLTKAKKGGYKAPVQAGGKSSTSEKLSKEFNVSERTIKRDGKFTEGLELIGKSNPTLKKDILAGKVKVKKSDIETLLEEERQDSLRVYNGKDIAIKADKIRKKSLQESKPQSLLQEDAEGNAEPLFPDSDYRLTRIKAQIISAVNQTIKQKDAKSVHTVKEWVKKLEVEVLG